MSIGHIRVAVRAPTLFKTPYKVQHLTLCSRAVESVFHVFNVGNIHSTVLALKGDVFRQTDLRVMLAGPKERAVGESGELHTGCEKGKGLWGVERIVAVIGTGGPVIRGFGGLTSSGSRVPRGYLAGTSRGSPSE
eukprot:183216-Prorocentrum_minimum.AAC.1